MFLPFIVIFGINSLLSFVSEFVTHVWKPAMQWVVYESMRRRYLRKVQHVCAMLDRVNTLLGDSTDADIPVSQEIVSQIIELLSDYVSSSSPSMIIRERKV